MGLDALIRSGFANIELIDEMYEKYNADPNSVDPSWKKAFAGHVDDFPPEQTNRNAPGDLRIEKLINGYRRWGHLKADVNPIRTTPLESPWQLTLDSLGFAEDELEKFFPTNNLLDRPEAPLKEIITILEQIYCSKIGIEYMGIQDPRLLSWIPRQIEPARFKISLSIDQKKSILQHLNKSELFEVFLHTKYVGQKRFSLEGGETLIPILAALIEKGSGLGLEQFVLGMAHRGRLNVLANILEKSYGTIFAEFEAGYIPISFEGSGDVKYHKGFTSSIQLNGKTIEVALTPNPSHLEAVDAVVEGQVRARQLLAGDTQREKVLPILVHGDAAIAGQGIVYETLQFYMLEGYTTGGTIHIIINNQIGFTTLPSDARSTYYCTDIARTFNAPVFHVNAEDPEGCVYATHLAMEIRQKFHCDVFIDLNCYRKYGHNEADEPAFTQPHEYQLIRSKRPIREIYRDDLIHQGVLEKQMAESLEEEFKDALQKAQKGIQAKENTAKKPPHKEKINPPPPESTGLDSKTLEEIAIRFCAVPEGLTVHKKLEKVISERLEMAKGKRPIDWGMGETLAYASLLWEGRHVRLSGQDSCRGTFSHRHALWKDQEEEKEYIPLQHLKEGQGKFEIYNSSLSEYAVLGFEFGYSLAYPGALVLWEAQFGDFCNGAQVIIDQFISTSEMKWGQKNSVVMLLPHGYEGQGPEHSSARMERFLTLCGHNNLQVVNPTTPAQLFHLLRRQILNQVNKPLIIFTPKGLLRHPECVSAIEDFTSGKFQEIIEDPIAPDTIDQLVFCSGRIYYDLIAEREKRLTQNMSIIRVEQLYPLDEDQLKKAAKKNAKQVYWVQDEPKNMGAWVFMRPYLQEAFNTEPRYIGRERSASPAAGSYALHQKQHQSIIEALFGSETE